MRCAVYGCNSCNRGKNANVDIVFHRFPKNQTLIDKWVNLCGRSNIFNPSTARVCSIHFVEEDYQKDALLAFYGIPNKYKKLNNQAIPSKCLPIQNLKKSCANITVPGGSTSFVNTSLIKTDTVSPITLFVPTMSSEHGSSTDTASEGPDNVNSFLQFQSWHSSSSTITLSERDLSPASLLQMFPAENNINDDMDCFNSSSARWHSLSERYTSSTHVKKKRRWRYTANMSDDCSSPTEASRKLNFAKNKIVMQNKKIKVLQQHIRRLKNKVCSLTAKLKLLDKKQIFIKNEETSDTDLVHHSESESQLLDFKDIHASYNADDVSENLHHSIDIKEEEIPFVPLPDLVKDEKMVSSYESFEEMDENESQLQLSNGEILTNSVLTTQCAISRSQSIAL